MERMCVVITTLSHTACVYCRKYKHKTPTNQTIVYKPLVLGQEWCGCMRQWRVFIKSGYIPVRYYWINVILRTNTPCFYIMVLFCEAKNEVGYVNIDRSKGNFLNSLGQHPGRLHGALWIYIPAFRFTWNFCDFVFLIPHLMCLGKVIQNLSELFNLGVLLSLAAGIKIQKTHIRFLM